MCDVGKQFIFFGNSFFFPFFIGRLGTDACVKRAVEWRYVHQAVLCAGRFTIWEQANA